MQELAPAIREPGPPGVTTVVRTIVFTDVVGSTRLADRYGDRALISLLDAHDDIGRVAAAEWQGQFVKSVGDGAMLAFDCASDAVCAAVDVQRGALAIELPLRVGADHGPVVPVGRRDYRGLVANVASRITMLAAPGEVLVSERVARACSLRGRAEERAIRGVQNRQPVRSVPVFREAI